jgi:hypothetical protein
MTTACRRLPLTLMLRVSAAGTSPTLKIQFRASGFSIGDTEMRSVGGRDRHETDARSFEEEHQMTSIGICLSFADLPCLGDAAQSASRY